MSIVILYLQNLKIDLSRSTFHPQLLESVLKGIRVTGLRRCVKAYLGCRRYQWRHLRRDCARCRTSDVIGDVQWRKISCWCARTVADSRRAVGQHRNCKSYRNKSDWFKTCFWCTWAVKQIERHKAYEIKMVRNKTLQLWWYPRTSSATTGFQHRSWRFKPFNR